MTPTEERRSHWECQSVNVCDERHKTQDERWEFICKALQKIEVGAASLNKLGYTLLGGVIVSLFLLIVNLIIMGRAKIPAIP